MAFLGIQAYPIEASPFGDEYKPPRDLWTMGGVYLDDEPFVGFEYRERHYRTMMAEDWGKGWSFFHFSFTLISNASKINRIALLAKWP